MPEFLGVECRSCERTSIVTSTVQSVLSLREIDMVSEFQVGDKVEWNSEAGRVRGIIRKRITTEVLFKGYKVHASSEEPQYLIENDQTAHWAMHKGSALTKLNRVTS